jgi:hypothetical protein
LKDIVLVQEQTPAHEIVVRIRPTIEAAADFVAGRLETHERMWDGCGYKVDYSEAHIGFRREGRNSVAYPDISG